MSIPPTVAVEYIGLKRDSKNDSWKEEALLIMGDSALQLDCKLNLE